MNQILSVNMPSGNNSNRNYKPNKVPGQKANIKSILVFFAVTLLIFGIILVLVGIMSGNSKDEGKKELSSSKTENKPRIDVSQEETYINAIIEGNNILEKVEYTWGDDTPMVIENPDAKKSLDIAIDIPEGTQILKITATDVEGLTNSFEKEYIGPEVLDAKITLQQQPNTNGISIICKSESKLKYIEYSFNGEKAVKTDVNDYTANIPLKEVQGDNNLKIVVVSEDGKKLTKTNTICLTTIKSNWENENFKINASNSQGLSKVELYINGKQEEFKVEGTEYEKIIPLNSGENKIGIMVYNKDGVMTRGMWKVKK